MKNKRNYYRLLHVQFDAPEPVIKGSYRTMMQKMRLHPDLGGDESHAQLLNEALATLLDPKKRAVYDQWLMGHQAESLKPRKTSESQPVPSNEVQEESATSSHPDANSADVGTVLCAFCQTSNHRASLHNKQWAMHRPVCRSCTAPLTAVDIVAKADVTGELRKVYRSVLHTSCEVQRKMRAEKAINADVLDFSPLGMSITHQGLLDDGECVLIRSDKFVCVARASYSHRQVDGLMRSGLEFLTLDMMMPRGELFRACY